VKRHFFCLSEKPGFQKVAIQQPFRQYSRIPLPFRKGTYSSIAQK
jgi:hypothetical protein